jgi:hypothetical protein
LLKKPEINNLREEILILVHNFRGFSTAHCMADRKQKERQKRPGQDLPFKDTPQ